MGNHPGRPPRDSWTILRALPSVERLLQDLSAAEPQLPRPLLVDASREALQAARARIAAGEPGPDLAVLANDAAKRAHHRLAPTLRPVVNASGVILHTNLGRAPLSAAAVAAMSEIGRGYTNLELELDSGERGSRASHLQGLLRDVTGAEDGLAVNNNAAAVLLCLSALAAEREVVISRGQAVEIGGGFRIPDVMRQSGARLVEVGTTNRTYLADYAGAITPQTALLLRVHPSNFRVEGFVSSVEVADLVELGRRSGVDVMDDVGSGALLDPRPFGLTGEPLVQESVQAGAAVTCFSGDKLLGGPQAGLIVGKHATIEKVRRHPLARAVRIDKLSLAALAATLQHYVRGEAISEIPIWRMIATPEAKLEKRARQLARQLDREGVVAIQTASTIGGGSLPQETLPSWAIRIAASPAHGGSAARLARRLRVGVPPIVGRIERDSVLLDLRTVEPADDAVIEQALKSILEGG
jgi:L-seryl-tRNA(Ser) seleniumtransferase